jgi:hypothetical protein
MFNFNFFNVRTQKIYSAQGKENPQNTIIQPNQNSVLAKERKEVDISSDFKEENKIPKSIVAIWCAVFILYVVLIIAIAYSVSIRNTKSSVTFIVQCILLIIFHWYTYRNLITRLTNYNDSINNQVEEIKNSANKWLNETSISPTQQLDSYIHERDFIEGVLNQRVTFLVSLFAAFLAALVAFVQSLVSAETDQSSLYIHLIALESVSFFAHLVFYFLCLATYRSYERIRFCIYACDILHRNCKAFNAGTVFKDYEKEKNKDKKSNNKQDGKFNASVLHHIGITIPLLVFYASFVSSLLASAAITLGKLK